MATVISELNTLNNSTGTIYVPVIKEVNGNYINYKASCASIVLNGQSAVNNIIRSYIDLYLVGQTDLSNFYTKDEVDKLIKAAVAQQINESTVTNIVNKMTLNALTKSDVLELIDNSLKNYVTTSDQEEALSNIQTNIDTSNLVTLDELEEVLAKCSTSTTSFSYDSATKTLNIITE